MYYNLINNLDFLFDVLENTQGVDQNPKYHPEGDVFIHSLQVLHYAFAESDNIDLIVAGMLHDVGKIIDTKGHEDYAIEMLGVNISPNTAWLIKNHMRIKYFLDGQMKKRSKVKELYNDPSLPKLLLLNRWDNIARKPHFKPVYNRQLFINRLVDLCGG